MSILKSAGVADSIDALRRSASGGGRGGRSAQLFLKGDSSVKVRFLQEPTQFMEFLEHYDAANKAFVPAIDNDPLDQHQDEKVRKVGKRWLANALNIEDGKIVIVKLNQDQLNRLLLRHTKYGTLLDRNYELIRLGSGRDSKYDVEADDPTQMDLSRFQDRCHDLTEYLLGEVDEYHNTTFQKEYQDQKAKQNGAAVQDAPVGHGEPEATVPAVQAAAQSVATADEGPPWTEQDLNDPKLNAAAMDPTSTTAGPTSTSLASTPLGTTLPSPASDPPGMSEIAAATEAERAAAAAIAAAQPVSTPAPLAAVPDPAPAAATDLWADAKAAGQPCVRGEDDKCVICGFHVSECLMKK